MRTLIRRVERLEAEQTPAESPRGPVVVVYQKDETTEAAAARLGVDLTRATTVISIPDNGRDRPIPDQENGHV